MTLPSLKWLPSPNFSSRGKRAIDLIVLHDCEGSYAGSINWFANPKSQVSAHYVLKEDGSEVTQMVDEANKAWHCVAFNSRSIGIEMAGFAAKGFDVPEWQAAADIVAYLLHKYSLPPHWSTGGVGPGFCSHYDLGAAGGGHKDPTTDPEIWEAFVVRVVAAYKADQSETWSGAKFTPTPIPPAPPAFVPSTTVRHDLVVGSIEWIQARLNALGTKPILSVDGLVGAQTRAAIVAFQKANNLMPDGIVGPKTIAALSSVPVAPKPSVAQRLAPALIATLVPETKEIPMFPTIVQMIIGFLPGVPDDITLVEKEVQELFSTDTGPQKAAAALVFAQNLVNVLRKAAGKAPVVFPD